MLIFYLLGKSVVISGYIIGIDYGRLSFSLSGTDHNPYCLLKMSSQYSYNQSEQKTRLPSYSFFVKSVVFCLVFLLSGYFFNARLNCAEDSSEWKAFSDQAESFYQNGRYMDSLKAAGEAVRVAEEVFGEQNLNVAASLSRLAQCYQMLGRYQDSERFFRKALSMTEALLGADHPNVGLLLMSTAASCRLQGKYSQAEGMLKRAQGAFEKSLGKKHPYVASAINDLGLIYSCQGRLMQAESLYNQALEIDKEEFGQNHPETALTLTNLASLLNQRGDYLKSEELYQQAMSMQRDSKSTGDLQETDTASASSSSKPRAFTSKKNMLSPKRSSQMDMLSALVSPPGSSRKDESSESPIYGHSLKSVEEAQGSDKDKAVAKDEAASKEDVAITDSPSEETSDESGLDLLDEARSMAGLSNLYALQGKYFEAESLARRALARAEQVLGKNHPEVAFALNNLAALYQAQGRYSEAEPIAKNALKLAEVSIGTDNPQSAIAMNTLAAIQHSQQQYDKAEESYRLSIEAWSKSGKPQHPDRAKMLVNLAHLYIEEGRASEAATLYKEALNIFENSLGPGSLYVEDTVYRLTNIQVKGRELPRPNSQQQRFQMVLAMAAESLNRRGKIYTSLGKLQTAEDLFKGALSIYEKTLGLNHPDVVLVLQNYAELLRRMGRNAEADAMESQAAQIVEKARTPSRVK